METLRLIAGWTALAVGLALYVLMTAAALVDRHPIRK